MGGDDAPMVNLQGAALAVKELDVHVFLVGPEDTLNAEIKKLDNWPSDRITVCHASEIVSMSESPVMSYRKKKNSSIRVAMNLVKEGKADAFVSAGNTGAVMATSNFVLGRIDGVDRPALAAVLPSKNDPYVMLDMGSNIDCKPHHLTQFAMMGNYFSQAILGVENPRVGLLNIGEEEDKGNQVSLTTHKFMKQLPINFCGNVEGRDITRGKADVVVCDGFVGNNMLKFGEGISKLFSEFFKEESKTSLISLISLFLLKPAFKRFKKKFDYDSYGGANLLGIKGVSIIAHGSAKKVAIKNAIKVAMRAHKNDVVSKIAKAIEETKNLNNELITEEESA
jgi:phosphate acyltransferase